MKGEKFLVVGKDKKMCACRDRIISKGYRCECTDKQEVLSVIPDYRYIILPLPTLCDGFITGTKIEIKAFISALTDKQTVFFGNISDSIFPLTAYSYYYNEAFLCANSCLTAQGVLRLILENVERDINLLSVAVLGYGRCGKEICRYLRNSGFSVTSFSRRTQTRLQAESNGVLSDDIKNITEKLYGFDIIVNTVPSNIIDKNSLAKFNDNSLYIETASKPFGFDVSEIDSCSFRYVSASGLPGRFTPISAGENIADTVLDIIKEGKHE